jgi:Ser/Thr protein kinase RdoA (MazF antagonist)
MTRMRPFGDLTRTGRARRVGALGTQVLRREYGLEPARLRLLSVHSFNTVLRVDRSTGSPLVLRVGDELRIHADGVEDVEAAWLDALASEGSFGTPTTLAGRDGRRWFRATTDGVPGARVCTLFTHVRGRPLRDRLDAEGAVAFGRLMARLHEHAASFEPPVPIPAGAVADRVIRFRDPTRIFEYRSPQGDLYVEAIARVQEMIDALWASPPHRPHLLHGDFGPQNVLRWRDELRPIDFQDLLFGFDVQDIGITLADLGRWSPEMAGPFEAGYAQVRPWPEIPPELRAAFAVARSLDVMNLGLNLRRAGIADFLEDHSRRVRAWMRAT